MLFVKMREALNRELNFLSNFDYIKAIVIGIEKMITDIR